MNKKTKKLKIPSVVTLGAAPMPGEVLSFFYWKRRWKKRIQAEAHRKRSEAARGNDNAAKDREKTVEQQNVAPSSKKHPEAQAKAAASKTNPGS